jgi:cytochrome b involved in lipid metabolism
MKKLLTIGIVMTSTLLLAWCSFYGSSKDDKTTPVEQVQSGTNTMYSSGTNEGTGDMKKDDGKGSDDQNEKNDDNTPNKPVTTPPAATPQEKTFSLADVQAHATASSCWTIVNGSVYDVTSWISQHPGGQRAIIGMCGKDGSAAFNGQHGWQARPVSELAGYKIGALK